MEVEVEIETDAPVERTLEVTQVASSSVTPTSAAAAVTEEDDFTAVAEVELDEPVTTPKQSDSAIDNDDDDDTKDIQSPIESVSATGDNADEEKKEEKGAESEEKDITTEEEEEKKEEEKKEDEDDIQDNSDDEELMKSDEVISSDKKKNDDSDDPVPPTIIDQNEDHMKMRERIRNELEIEKNYIIAEHFDKPNESIEFDGWYQIQVLGQRQCGRESLLMQWIYQQWDHSQAHSDTYFWHNFNVHGRQMSSDVRRGYQGSNDDDYNHSSIEDTSVSCFVIIADVTDPQCSDHMNRMLEYIMDNRRDYRSLSVVLAAAKCDAFLGFDDNSNDNNDGIRVKDQNLKLLIRDNIEDLKQLTKRFYKQDLSIVFIPTSAKYNWNVECVFQACIAQWMSVHEYEYLEAKRVQQELSKDAALDCCMNPLVLALYDAVTIIVSLADISTDLWVLIHWYSLGRWTPFYISLTILSCAQLSYIGAFITRFCDNGNWSFKVPPKYSYQKSLWPVMLVIVPISPLLSFVMYFASLKDGCLGKWMDDHGFDIDQPTPSKNSSKIERFLVEKLFKHMGFLLEAGVEAFPQSILQMAVMVSYSETNWVSVVSILLSLISVCTKSLVFSYALELRTMLFNYLSLCLDFISIFALISWIFYNPNGNGITTLGQIFLYRVGLTTAPFITVCGFIVATAISFEDWHYQRRYGTKPYRRLFKRLCLFYTMWIFGTPFMILMSEVACCAGLAFIMFLLFSNRFSSGGAASVFWGHVFDFVNDGRTWKDKKLRAVLVCEAVLCGNGSSDFKLKNYISNSRQQTYSTVTWKGLRMNVQDPDMSTPCSIAWTAQREILKEQRERTAYLLDWQEVKNRWNSQHYGWKHVIGHIISWPIGLFCVYFAMPVYVFSRFFNFSFVWIAFLSTKFNDIDHLQLGMAGLLGLLQCTWMIALIMVLRLHFVTWHVLSGHSSVWVDVQTQEGAFVRLKRITDLHDAHTLEPLRKQVIIEHFGPDIASVLLDYIPTLIYDIGENQGGL